MNKRTNTELKISQAELDSQLSHFTGTCDWHKHQLTGFLYTDGISYCAETFGMYWFLDIVFFENKPKLLDEFQVWKLVRNSDYSCVITADDGNDNILFTKKIEYTDFPSESIEFYFTNNVLLLPSEN